ncbi:MAG: hypothetical protein QXG25_02920 [Nitrososphaerota archaeon]
MSPPSPSRGRRGISEFMAVLLMIVAAIAIGALVWIYSASQAQSLARNPNIDIIDARVIATSGGGGSALVGVKNTGSVAVNIQSITVTGAGSCSFSVGSQPSLSPGQVAYFTASSCSGLQPGQRVVIEVRGQAVTGEDVRAMAAAVVM